MRNFDKDLMFLLRKTIQNLCKANQVTVVIHGGSNLSLAGTQIYCREQGKRATEACFDFDGAVGCCGEPAATRMNFEFRSRQNGCFCVVSDLAPNLFASADLLGR